MENESKITIRSLLVGTLFAGFFAYLTVYFENRKSIYVTATQVAVLPYALLFLMVLMINPVCRFLRFVRHFTVAEVLIVFIMGSVSSGISTFGLASQLVPVITGAFNEHWNNEQTEWNRYVEPFVHESFFISEPGIQKAAKEYRDTLLKVRASQKVYDAAFQYTRTQEALTKAKATLAEVEGASMPDAEKALAISKAKQSVKTATNAFGEKEAHWNSAKGDHSSPESAVTNLPKLLDTEKAAMQAKREALAELERKAFAKVARYRRGLKEEERAFPGFVPLPGENFNVYQARLKRLKIGTAALKHLRAARASIDGGVNAAELSEKLGKAIEALGEISDPSHFSEQKKILDEEWETWNNELQAVQEKLRDARNKRRLASGTEAETLDKEIRLLAKDEKRLTLEKRDTDLRKEVIVKQLKMVAKVGIAKSSLEAMNSTLAANASPAADELAAQMDEVAGQFRYFDASMQRYLVGDVPWSIWFRPFMSWGLILLLSYVVLMTFNVLIFRQWAHNEKLSYPLAELPKMLVGAGDEDSKGGWPPIFRSGFFWFGVSISASFLGYNLLAYSSIIPNLTPLDFNNKWSSHIVDTPFEGLKYYVGKSHVFFTMIGLAFLIPANISFSLWFFVILYMLEVLLMVWMGYGTSERSWKGEWWYTLNFMSAQGAGAMMVFATVVLYKCRKYLLCAFNGKAIGELDVDEQKELRFSSFLFLSCSLGLILMLWLYMGANIYYTIFSYLVIMMITIVLVRAVAEGGILGFQAWVSPFHFIRSVVGMDKTWSSPSLFAPLFIYYSVLFLDIKSFIAPAMANSIKIRDDLKMKRGRFHASIFLGILIAVVVAVLGHVLLGYSRGGDAMNSWFHTGFPRGLFNQIAAMTKSMPVDNQGTAWWLLAGGIAMTALLYFRQSFFWLPHPLGLVMLVNPIMRTYWFSIMIGWLCKHLVTKYGNNETYRHAKSVFVGLIAGELFIIVLALVLSVALEVRIPIDLNRN